MNGNEELQLLRAEIDRLRSEVDEMRAERTTAVVASDGAQPPGPTATEANESAPMSRRRWMGAAAAAAVGGTAAALAGSTPAAAATADLETGNTSQSNSALTAARYSGSSVGRSGFQFHASDDPADPNQNHPAALAGVTTQADHPTGVVGTTSVNSVNASGVTGYTSSVDAVAVRASHLGARGVALDAQGHVGIVTAGNEVGLRARGVVSAIQLESLLVGRPGQYFIDQQAGMMTTDDTQNELWFCSESGAPGKWHLVAGGASAGAFIAIEPHRVYDSRAASPTPGRLTAGDSRVISVADGRDLVSGAVNATDLVEEGATAITYNITVDDTVGGGYLGVVPGNATEVKAAAVNWSSSGLTLGNAAVVKLDDDRQIKVLSGGVGSTHFVIDITGYYL